MDYRTQATQALDEQKKNEAVKQDRHTQALREKSAEKLSVVLKKFFGDNVIFYIFYEDSGDAFARVEGVNEVKFWRVWQNVGTELMGEYNENQARLFDMASLGKLLATEKPEVESEPEEKKTTERFDVVTIRRANVLHNEGRVFKVLGMDSYEGDDYLIIEFIDLYKFEPIDDDVPF